MYKNLNCCISFSQIARLLCIVDSGQVNQWKGRQLKDINLEGKCNLKKKLTEWFREFHLLLLMKCVYMFVFNYLFIRSHITWGPACFLDSESVEYAGVTLSL